MLFKEAKMKSIYSGSLDQILKERRAKEGKKAFFLLRASDHFLTGSADALLRKVRKRHIKRGDVTILMLIIQPNRQKMMSYPEEES